MNLQKAKKFRKELRKMIKETDKAEYLRGLESMVAMLVHQVSLMRKERKECCKNESNNNENRKV